MITMFSFDIDTAELVHEQQWRMHGAVHTSVSHAPSKTRECVGISVKEGDDAFDDILKWLPHVRAGHVPYSRVLDTELQQVSRL